MFIEQMYTNCLAEAAYYIESEGEAVIIDPIRDIQIYLDKLAARGARLKYIIETHFHADFVSGHIDLAAKTGAKIVYGPGAETNYKIKNVADGEELLFGKVKLKALHTPGHTPESTCFLLLDEKGKEHSVFTGDTLFVGDVGRPDLLDGKMSKEELAGKLYNSLTKLTALPDNVIVYPAHGPGSACGKNIGKETWSTIGEQKAKNYALAEMSKKDFISAVTSGLAVAPKYFAEDVKINKTGYTDFDSLMNRSLNPLTPQQLEEKHQKGAIILDTRIPDQFEKGFIKGSINIGLNGQYAIWTATLVDMKTPIIIVAEEGKENESIMRLARVGYENVHGYLKGGINAWKDEEKELDTIQSITPEQFVSTLKNNKISILDVRKPGELEGGRVEGAININLADLDSEMSSLKKDNTYYIHCAGGYRSMIAASKLKEKGFKNLINVYGGFAKIKEAGAPVVIPEVVNS